MNCQLNDIVIISKKLYGHNFDIGEKVKIIEVFSTNYKAESLITKKTWHVEDTEILYDLDMLNLALINMGYPK